MKILHTEWSDGLGGQEKRVLAELIGLAGRGHEVSLVCRHEGRIRAEAEKHGIRVFTLPLKRPLDVSSILRLRAIIKEHGVEIVNTHSGVDAWIGALAAKLAGAPLLVRTRHLNIPLRRSIINFVHYLPDLYITCGENMRHTLVDDCGFPADRVVSIPTGVDERFFNVKRNPELRARYGLGDRAPVVVNVGILRRVKGHEVTLKAAKAVLQSIPEARFLIVGDGPLRQSLEKMMEELGMGGAVMFTGFVEDVADIYAAADVAVLSSWSEGLPQSMLQAMAAGVPVVATRVGGVPEVIVDGLNGVLVGAGDDTAMAAGIVKLLRDKNLARDMALKAGETVREGHSLDRMLQKTEQVYQDFLRRKRS
jgi:glycosyltransferase involved in cell wall biosynthesis